MTYITVLGFTLLTGLSGYGLIQSWVETGRFLGSGTTQSKPEWLVGFTLLTPQRTSATLDASQVAKPDSEASRVYPLDKQSGLPYNATNGEYNGFLQWGLMEGYRELECGIQVLV